MLTLNHTLTGGLVGIAVRNNVAAFILSIVLHLLLDKIPHFWPNEKKKKAFMSTIDWSVSFIFIAYIFYNNGFLINSIFMGALGGFLVDVIIISIPFIYKSKLGKWHTKRQPHFTSLSYLLTDGALLAVSIVLLTILL